MDPIDSFSGEYRWLSNFHYASVQVGELVFPTNEHAYQAAKSLDPADWQTIINNKYPSFAKSVGRKIKLRPDWESIKLDVMRELVAAKFDQHPDLKEKLLATAGRELIEGNFWGDRFWGTVDGVGQNHLGKILMDYRSKYIGH